MSGSDVSRANGHGPSATVLRHAALVAAVRGGPAPRAGEAMAEIDELRGAALVFVDGRIAWRGLDADLPALSTFVPRDGARGVDEIDCRGCCVIPAFADPHTHLVFVSHRRNELEQRLAGADYETIFAAGGGILASVRQTRSADDESLRTATRARLNRMLALGTTSFEIKSGYGLDVETELRQLGIARALERDEGIRVLVTCMAAHAYPAQARGSEAGRRAWVETICAEILPRAAQGLADDCDVFCDRGAFDVDDSRRILLAARALGLGLRLHANELGATGGAGLAAELAVTSADHLLYVDDADRRALAAAGVIATLLPGTSLSLRKPFADGRAMVKAGVAVALATDCNPGSCGIESMGVIMALSCFQNGLSPAQALCAATHNAAAAMRRSDRVGRLEPGLDADVLVLGTDDWRDLIARGGVVPIDRVYARGCLVARNGAPCAER